MQNKILCLFLARNKWVKRWNLALEHLVCGIEGFEKIVEDFKVGSVIKIYKWFSRVHFFCSTFSISFLFILIS